jgi:hypothetical protein
MTGLQRRAALAAAALATLLAAVWVSREEQTAEAVVDVARAAPAEARREGAALPVASPASITGAARAPFPDLQADLFAPRSWTLPVVEKPRAPTAPPLPYTYFGRMTEDGKDFVFLQRGERTYTVTGGDLLDQQYRIEEITPAAVVMTYLPLNQRQMLNTGSQ